ncbi:MAG TPA: YbdD/YjiX family protein [Gemmatimonadaceae bacterium]
MARGTERRRPLLLERLTSMARAVRAVLGAPDYDRYLAHLARRHPDAVPLSRAEFLRDRLRKRYDEPGSRCC